jgi:hypothetical protein
MVPLFSSSLYYNSKHTGIYRAQVHIERRFSYIVELQPSDNIRNGPDGEGLGGLEVVFGAAVMGGEKPYSFLYFLESLFQD